MKIVFRVDGGGGIGLGHLMRCVALADACRAQGHAPLFICKDNPSALQLFQERGYEVHKISSQITLQEELNQLPQIIQNGDLLVVDGYAFTSAYLAALHQALKGKTVLVYIDDLMDRELPVDLVLGNVYATREEYATKLLPETVLVTGPKYLPLRQEFQALPKKGISDQIRNVLITFGGEDPANITQKVVEALSHHKPSIHLEILLGPAYPHEVSLQQVLAGYPHPHQIHRNPSNLAVLYQKADVAIAASGITVWELAAAGTPMLIIQAVDNQFRIARYAQQQHLGIVLGWHIAVNALRINSGLLELADKQVRADFSKRTQALFDGKGALRIVKALSTSVLAKQIVLKQADKEPEGVESRLLLKWRNDPITREMSRNTEIVSLDEHRQWFLKTSNDEKRLILIGYCDAIPVGMVRLDRQDVEVAEIGINLNPEMRGKGFGTALLQAVCSYAFGSLGVKRIKAVVKSKNLASINIFEGTGFVLQSEADGFREYLISRV